jgi:hypothetical protein
MNTARPKPLPLRLPIVLSHRAFVLSRPRAAFPLPRTSSVPTHIHRLLVRARPFFRPRARRRPPSMEADPPIARLQHPTLRLPPRTLLSTVRRSRHALRQSMLSNKPASTLPNNGSSSSAYGAAQYIPRGPSADRDRDRDRDWDSRHYRGQRRRVVKMNVF